MQVAHLVVGAPAEAPVPCPSCGAVELRTFPVWALHPHGLVCVGEISGCRSC